MNGNEDKSPFRLSGAGWLAIAILLGLLIWAIWYVVYAFTSISGAPISAYGWTMMALGVVFTLAVGGGLMALMFYSNRKNYDQ